MRSKSTEKKRVKKNFVKFFRSGFDGGSNKKLKAEILDEEFNKQNNFIFKYFQQLLPSSKLKESFGFDGGILRKIHFLGF